MVVGAVICRQCDDRVGHEVLPPRVFCARCAPRSGKALRTFDANGATVRRQEIARRLLCNRQRATSKLLEAASRFTGHWGALAAFVKFR
jgi:hypothetical protein